MKTTNITKIVAKDKPNFSNRIKVRNMSNEDFIKTKASGTLRKNQSIGMNISSQLLHERIAYEFGYYFECLPQRFISFGEARSEGDCKPITEIGWYVERYKSINLYPGDEIETKYIIVEDSPGNRREGIGLVFRTTSYKFVPNSYMIFCIIIKYNPITHDFEPAINPC